MTVIGHLSEFLNSRVDTARMQLGEVYNLIAVDVVMLILCGFRAIVIYMIRCLINSANHFNLSHKSLMACDVDVHPWQGAKITPDAPEWMQKKGFNQIRPPYVLKAKTFFGCVK